MKICPKCHEEVEDSFEICWNCNYSFPDDKILDMTPAEESDDSGRSIDCLRCQVRMVYSGKYEFHEGMNTGIFPESRSIRLIRLPEMWQSRVLCSFGQGAGV